MDEYSDEGYGGGAGGMGDYGGDYGAGGGGYGGGDYGEYGQHDGGATVAPPKEFHSIAEITDFLSETEIESTVIGYFDLETNAEDKKIFDEVLVLPLLAYLSSCIPFYPQTHRIGQYRYRFGFTTNKDVLKEMKYKGAAVVVYRPVMPSLFSFLL
jgi:hypothetical protein